MPAVSVTGQDTVTLDGNIVQTMADGNPFDVTFPNDLVSIKVGKNGNSIYGKNEQGRRADVALRILKAGTDDKYLIGKIAEWKADPSTFAFITGIFIKKVGDGQGNVVSMVYNCTGGVVARQPEAKTASDGDAEQSVSMYTLQFSNCDISFQ